MALGLRRMTLVSRKHWDIFLFLLLLDILYPSPGDSFSATPFSPRVRRLKPAGSDRGGLPAIIQQNINPLGMTKSSSSQGEESSLPQQSSPDADWQCTVLHGHDEDEENEQVVSAPNSDEFFRLLVEGDAPSSASDVGTAAAIGPLSQKRLGYQPAEWSCTVLHEGDDEEEEYCVLIDSVDDIQATTESETKEGQASAEAVTGSATFETPLGSSPNSSFASFDLQKSLQIMEGEDQLRIQGTRLASLTSSSQELQPSNLADLWDTAWQVKPLVLSLLAFWSYDPVAKLFRAILAQLEAWQNLWVAVDGGAYQALIIAPAINGVVVPAMALVFATMIATTISSLKTRLKEITSCMHLEVTQLRILSTCLEQSPLPRKNSTIQEGKDTSVFLACQYHIWQYTNRLLEEATQASTSDVDLELVWNALETTSELDQKIMPGLYAVAESHTLPPLIWEQALEACHKLQDQRIRRITALQSTFPTLHFMVLIALGSSLLVAFLMETNQDVLVFLNAIQLRLLWSSLVGTGSVLALVCYDLTNPFRGSYRISERSSMTDQLLTLKQGMYWNLKLAVNTISSDQKATDVDEMIRASPEDSWNHSDSTPIWAWNG